MLGHFTAVYLSIFSSFIHLMLLLRFRTWLPFTPSLPAPGGPEYRRKSSPLPSLSLKTNHSRQSHTRMAHYAVHTPATAQYVSSASRGKEVW